MIVIIFELQVSSQRRQACVWCGPAWPVLGFCYFLWLTPLHFPRTKYGLECMRANISLVTRGNLVYCLEAGRLAGEPARFLVFSIFYGWYPCASQGPVGVRTGIWFVFMNSEELQNQKYYYFNGISILFADQLRFKMYWEISFIKYSSLNHRAKYFDSYDIPMFFSMETYYVVSDAYLHEVELSSYEIDGRLHRCSIYIYIWIIDGNISAAMICRYVFQWGRIMLYPMLICTKSSYRIMI